MKVIFHDSRDDFIKMYNGLHKDFSERMSNIAFQMSKVDEVRNLYERQIEMYKEDLKRIDLKVEKSIREVQNESSKQKINAQNYEEGLTLKLDELVRDMT